MPYGALIPESAYTCLLAGLALLENPVFRVQASILKPDPVLHRLS